MQDIVDNPIYQRLQNVTLVKDISATREPHCPVCLIAFEDEDHFLMDKTCGMGFHTGCLLEWLTKKSNCPWCRQCLKTHNRAATQGLIESTNTMYHRLENTRFEEFIDYLNHELRDIYMSNADGDGEALWADILQLLFSCYGDEEQRYFLEGLTSFLRLVVYLNDEGGDDDAVLAEILQLLFSGHEDEEHQHFVERRLTMRPLLTFVLEAGKARNVLELELIDLDSDELDALRQFVQALESILGYPADTSRSDGEDNYDRRVRPSEAKGPSETIATTQPRQHVAG